MLLLVISGIGGLIVSVRVDWHEPKALVADNVTVNVPYTVGVPLIRPVAASMPRPAGRPAAP